MSGPSRPQPRWSRFHAQGSQQPPRTEPAVEDDAPLSLPTGAGNTPTADAPVTARNWLAEENAPEPPSRGEDVPAPAAAPGELPRAFQLRHVYAEPPLTRGRKEIIYLVLGGFLLLAAGGAAGYAVGSSRPAPHQGAALRMQPANGLTLALSEKTQAAVDDAFQASKDHHYTEAQTQFAALFKGHPEWPSMAIEDARASLYDKNSAAAVRTLTELMHSDSVPDADFLMALAYLMHKEFNVANQHFAMATALDPARADIYYFWGECLRTEGKPREAVEKFREALLRNQYETAETLFQLKLWLSQIQSDQEESSGANAKIDAALATTPRPPYSALFAAAARAIKIGGFKDAADWIAKGQQLTEPVVFRVILQDPVFFQESWRPELKGFYK